MKEKLGKVVKTVTYRECSVIKDGETSELIVRCATVGLAESVCKTIAKLAPGRQLVVETGLGTVENIGRDLTECMDIVTNGEQCGNGEEPESDPALRDDLNEDPETRLQTA